MRKSRLQDPTHARTGATAAIHLFAAVCFCVISALPTAAQVDVGSVSGAAVDPNGALIPGAHVILTEVKLGVSREMRTDATGSFRFDRVEPGAYAVRIEKPGFRAQQTTGLIVTAGKDTSAGRIALRLGSPSDTVVVNGSAAALLETQSAQITSSFESKQVTDLAFGTFGFDAVAFLAPGVTPGLGSVRTNTEGLGSLAVNGVRSRFIGFTLDGQDNNDAVLSGPAFLIQNPELVQELQIVTNQFSAENGRNAGATVTVVTRRGTNAVHGGLFWRHRNDSALGTTTSRQSQLGATKPSFNLVNEWGLGIGGPVIRNKLFGYGSYRANRSVTREFLAGTSSALSITPAGIGTLSAAGIAGSTLEILKVQSALAPGRDIGNARCSIGALNSLPAGFTSLDTTNTLAYQTILGVPNVEFCAPERDIPTPSQDLEGTYRMDWEGMSDSVWGRYAYQSTDAATTMGDALAGFVLDREIRNHLAGLTWTHRFSQRMLNEVRLQYARFDFRLGGGSTFPLSEADKNLTRIVLGPPYLGLGLTPANPNSRQIPRAQFMDNWSYLWRSHQLRAGVELRWNRLSGFFLPFYVGEFDFVAAGGRNAFENFLVNSPSQVQFTAGETVSHGSQVDHAYYFQDDVRLRPNLTLNLGIRLESLGQVLNTEAEKVLRRERDSASAFWLQSLSLAERTIPFLPRRFNVGPRAGLAWTPRLASWLFGKEQTVIRAGYAIAYDVGPDNLDADVLVSAPRVFFFICSLAPSAPCAPFPIPGNGSGNAVQSAVPTPRNTLDPRLQGQTRLAADFASPYAQHWTFGLQRQIGDTAFEIRYVATRGVKLFQGINANPVFGQQFALFPQTVPSGLAPDVTSGRLDPDFRDLRVFCNCGRSRYDGLQTRWTFRSLFKQFSGGLAYTWSRASDNVSETANFLAAGSRAFSPNPFDYSRGEWALSNFHLRHTFTAHWIWEVPAFRAQTPVLSKILAGWELSGSGFLYSGQPWTPFQSTSFNSVCDENQGFSRAFNGARTACRPFFTGFDNGPSSVGLRNSASPTGFLDRAGNPVPLESLTWVINDDNAMGFFGTPFGNGRNIFFGDNTVLFNVGFIKNTRFGPDGRFNAQLRVTSRNIFNHRNFGVPPTNIDNAATFGALQANDVEGRFFELGLRFEF